MRKAPKPSLMDRLRRKKALLNSPKIGVCWYTEEEWIKIKKEAIDPERFETTYSEWESMAKNALQDLKKTGLNPVKVIVLADELKEWCAIHGKENSSASRSEFVAQLLSEKRAITA